MTVREDLGTEGDGTRNFPKVAIILCTYNPDRQFLKEQVDSIKKQTFKNWICFVNDDFSDPEFTEFIKEAVGTDDRFKIHFWETNHGTVYNFERGLNLVTPEFEFVALSDQDDVWYDHKLEVMLELLKNSGLSVAHSDLRVIDESGRQIHASCWKMERRNVFDFSPWRLIYRNSVTGCSMLFRRQLLDCALPFPRQKVKRPTFFHDQWLALAAQGAILPISKPLIDYRQHSGNQVGARQRKWIDRLRQLRYIIVRIQERMFLVRNLLDLKARENEKSKAALNKTKTSAPQSTA
jgi:glycosyltransferase involved in cell wall biosynthesis